MKTPKVRRQVIGFRVSDEEQKQITAAASAQELTSSEWLRALALGAIIPNPSIRVLAEEIIAVRLILQNVIGHLVDAEVITGEILRNSCAHADRVKKDRARALFSAGPALQELTSNVQ